MSVSFEVYGGDDHHTLNTGTDEVDHSQESQSVISKPSTLEIDHNRNRQLIHPQKDCSYLHKWYILQ